MGSCDGGWFIGDEAVGGLLTTYNFLSTYSRSRTLPSWPDLGNSVSSSSGSCTGKGVTNGLSSSSLVDPRSIVTYSRVRGVTGLLRFVGLN